MQYVNLICAFTQVQYKYLGYASTNANGDEYVLTFKR